VLKVWGSRRLRRRLQMDALEGNPPLDQDRWERWAGIALASLVILAVFAVAYLVVVGGKRSDWVALLVTSFIIFCAWIMVVIFFMLGRTLNQDVAHNDDLMCIACGEKSCVSGKFKDSDRGAAVAWKPTGLWETDLLFNGGRTDPTFPLCTACGFLWSSLDAGKAFRRMQDR